MTEKNVVDIFLLEMIGIHLKKLNTDFNGAKENELIKNAESIIDNLDEKSKHIVMQYIDNLIEHMAAEELCLYKAGIKDGIRLLNWISLIDSEW